MPNEEVVLDAVVRWVQHCAAARGAQLGALLEHVRLPLLAQDALVARAAAEPLASAGLRVKDLLIEALSFHLLRPERRAAAAAACARARPRQPPRSPKLLLVVGGQAPKAIRDVEAFQLDAARWRPAAELPTRRCRAGLAVVNGKVYAVGGFNGETGSAPPPAAGECGRVTCACVCRHPARAQRGRVRRVLGLVGRGPAAVRPPLHAGCRRHRTRHLRRGRVSTVLSYRIKIYIFVSQET